MSNMSQLQHIKQAIRKIIDASKYDNEARELIHELIAIGKSEPKKKSTRRKTAQPSVNPFEVFRESGLNGLEKSLERTDVDDLIQIIMYYGLDPSRKSHRWSKKDRLKKLIADRVHSKASQGDVFSS